MRKQRGFTLAEMLVAVFVLATLSGLVMSVISSAETSRRLMYQEKQHLTNDMITSALLDYAANQTTTGSLPPPYTGASYTSTVYNPADASAAGVALTTALLQTGLASTEINDDGRSARNVRVYQRVANLTSQVPLYVQSGPLVTLTYQAGAVYMTACPIATASCNPSASGVPGSSPAMTTGSFQTWNTTGTDLAPSLISTLPLQKQMLSTTVQRAERIRDALLSYLRAQQVTAAAGDATNWYPAGSTSLGGVAPASNQGCRDGWYDLTSTNILPTIGLSVGEFATTAWGGRIEYCRDYDPIGTKAANAPPHYAAIRFNANVTAANPPDAAVIGNNVILSI